MSYVTTAWRPFARMGWGGKASTHWRGQTPPLPQDPQWQGQIGTVVYRSPGARANTFVTGVTRDSTGAALGNCTVHLFITGSDALVLQKTSDASGNFTFEQPGSGPFYIVAYLAGSPDVAGTTVNTLVAT